MRKDWRIIIMNEFFEYKFLAMEFYYKYVCEENFTYLQAGERCLVDFTLILSENTIKSLAIYSTVLVQIARYAKENIKEVKKLFENEYEKLIEIYNSLPLDDILSENEREYLNDDIDFIKYKFKK